MPRQVRDDFDNETHRPLAGSLHQSVELPAYHFHWPNRRRAGGRWE